VVAEDQPDLAACFEPGAEVVVWRDIAELNETYERLRRAPQSAAAIGARGRRRVLADHTYARRLEALGNLL
jgi:spore maturation protein CgeB